MSTRIRITGVDELQQRLQKAQEANRLAALQRQADNADLQVFTPATPAQQLLQPPPLRSLLSNRAGIGAGRQRNRRKQLYGVFGTPGPIEIILTPNPYDPSYGTSYEIFSEDSKGGSYSVSELFSEEPPKLGPPEDGGNSTFYFVSYGHTVTAGIVMPSSETFGLYVFMFWYVRWRVSWNRIPGVRIYYARETFADEQSFSYDPSTGYVAGTPGAEDDAFYFKYIEPMAALTAREEFSSEVGGPTIPNVPGQSVISSSTIIEWR